MGIDLILFLFNGSVVYPFRGRTSFQSNGVGSNQPNHGGDLESSLRVRGIGRKDYEQFLWDLESLSANPVTTDWKIRSAN